MVRNFCAMLILLTLSSRVVRCEQALSPACEQDPEIRGPHQAPLLRLLGWEGSAPVAVAIRRILVCTDDQSALQAIVPSSTTQSGACNPPSNARSHSARADVQYPPACRSHQNETVSPPATSFPALPSSARAIRVTALRCECRPQA